MFHWTEHNIRFHAFAFVLAPQIAHLMRLEADRAGTHTSARELLHHLAGIGERVLIYPNEGGRPEACAYSPRPAPCRTAWQPSLTLSI